MKHFNLIKWNNILYVEIEKKKKKKNIYMKISLKKKKKLI